MEVTSFDGAFRDVQQLNSRCFTERPLGRIWSALERQTAEDYDSDAARFSSESSGLREMPSPLDACARDSPPDRRCTGGRPRRTAPHTAPRRREPPRLERASRQPGVDVWITTHAERTYRPYRAGMSHTVTITRTTTSSTGTALFVNTGYLGTLPGLLKLAELSKARFYLQVTVHQCDKSALAAIIRAISEADDFMRLFWKRCVNSYRPIAAKRYGLRGYDTCSYSADPSLKSASFGLLGAACVGVVGYYWDHNGGPSFNMRAELFFFLVSVALLIGTFCLVVSCLASLSSATLLSKSIYEVIYHGLAFILYLSAGLTLIIEVNHKNKSYTRDYEPFMAASISAIQGPRSKSGLGMKINIGIAETGVIMGLVLAALYLLSTFLANRSYRGI
ncbi:hypothetical protein EVAR_5514_1 [Eumeta japonica]|uniref:MARVEL domain-containing protein n=1 Tax=Eumeta variegata TaxID=151549 RepID=A0A4C1T8W4_EUMVA|nr:hypothetical protein EVAR_5514_1 [Eumeta japonica]